MGADAGVLDGGFDILSGSGAALMLANFAPPSLFSTRLLIRGVDLVSSDIGLLLLSSEISLFFLSGDAGGSSFCPRLRRFIGSIPLSSVVESASWLLPSPAEHSVKSISLSSSIGDRLF